MRRIRADLRRIDMTPSSQIIITIASTVRRLYNFEGGLAQMADAKKDVIKAAKSGDLENVKALVEADASLIHVRDSDGSTALHYAVWKGHKAVAEFLVKIGADVNANNSNEHWGSTPLHAAAHANQAIIA